MEYWQKQLIQSDGVLHCENGRQSLSPSLNSMSRYLVSFCASPTWHGLVIGKKCNFRWHVAFWIALALHSRLRLRFGSFLRPPLHSITVNTCCQIIRKSTATWRQVPDPQVQVQVLRSQVRVRVQVLWNSTRVLLEYKYKYTKYYISAGQAHK